MASETWYAWTDIAYADNKGARQTARRGDSVTANKLNIDEDEFDQLKESRAVRRSKYPDMPANYGGSPREFILEERTRQLRDIEDNFDVAELTLEADKFASGEVDEDEEVKEDEE